MLILAKKQLLFVIFTVNRAYTTILYAESEHRIVGPYESTSYYFEQFKLPMTQSNVFWVLFSFQAAIQYRSHSKILHIFHPTSHLLNVCFIFAHVLPAQSHRFAAEPNRATSVPDIINGIIACIQSYLMLTLITAIAWSSLCVIQVTSITYFFMENSKLKTQNILLLYFLPSYYAYKAQASHLHLYCTGNLSNGMQNW